MKILKILGIVASVHVVAAVLLFAIQGCNSTNKSAPPPPAGTDSAPATVQFNSANNTSPVALASTPANNADLNPATAPVSSAVSFNDSPALYSPTRPGTAAATAIASSAPGGNVRPVATYTVVKGDSFSKIAAKYHLTQIELAKANNLKLSAPLILGQKLIIPGKAPSPGKAATASTSGGPTYIVKSGDSLKLIAKRNGTTVAALKSLNHLKGDSVRLGQELKLPPGVAPAQSSSVPIETSTSSSAPVPSDTVKGTGGLSTYTVKPGEKLSTIAKKYGLTVGELATANNISDPGKIRAGQELIIPNGGSAAGSKPAKVAPTAPSATPTPPPAGGDLDSGLKPTAEEPPVIKVEDTSSPPPAPAPKIDTSSPPQNP